MANSVNISIEAPIENQIQEITYDGQEIYQAPLSMSENLARLAQKIDFSKSEDEYCNIKKEGETSVEVKSDEDSKEAGYQSSQWPWESVRNKLRNALTEVCVLADVLSIAKEKRYMVLDPVQPEQVENRPMVQVYGRKKALAAAAAVLMAGVDRLRASETMRTARNMPDFHIDLLRLRQNWRLKKGSTGIVGDLSYRTAGSKFNQTGVFEVTKAAEEATAGAGAGGGAALRVAVPPELQGVAFISVLCQKEQEEVATAAAGGAAEAELALHWQQRLEAAQNVLFCKELFARLAAEAVQLDASIPHMVVGNQIMATVLPGIQLLIGLCHNNGQNNSNTHPESVKAEGAAGGKSEHDHVLEHSLHQLLRAVHHANTHHPFPHPATGPLGPSKRRCVAGTHSLHTTLAAHYTRCTLHSLHTTLAAHYTRCTLHSLHTTLAAHYTRCTLHSLHQLLRAVHHANTHHPFPHPATGPLGPSKRRCVAGPMAADRYELLEMSKEQSLLEQIIQQAQHFFMRRRSEYVLDTIAKEVKDPLIVSHWNALNSPTQSCVKINIMAYGYDAVCRTSLVVHVGEKTLKCICRDGRVRHLSYELQELRDLIYCQIYQHQMTAVQAVGRCMGWQLLASSSHLGSGPVEPLGNASSCLLASPNGDRMIAIRCEPSVGIQVFIAQSPRKDFFASELVQDKKWENLGGAFKEIKLEKMEGKNFLNKMELLMACLSSPS
ncbi:mediator of RNA polymerase II transcription subunit 17 isoform X2 [Galleria mellonella]|uniref:Mediator of RNA polymerase II transcription subunit 17 isoform X2 n=1 Tax=Galleria mellonella TaxID=7137 RepID=A0ABM3MT71_GALME|nr:mediator of RNA polymerase II transcription subunit 17 isoform X2 [Galleria mellonella]